MDAVDNNRCRRIEDRGELTLETLLPGQRSSTAFVCAEYKMSLLIILDVDPEISTQ